MSEALRTVDLPAEAIAVIKEGVPKSRAETSALASAAPVVSTGQPRPVTKAIVEGRQVAGSESLQGICDAEETSTVLPSTRRKPRDARDGEPEQMVLGPSASMTVRLPGDIPPKLLRVATDRKIAKQRPFTQQEIVAEALAQWLKKHGY